MQAVRSEIGLQLLVGLGDPVDALDDRQRRERVHRLLLDDDAAQRGGVQAREVERVAVAARDDHHADLDAPGGVIAAVAVGFGDAAQAAVGDHHRRQLVLGHAASGLSRSATSAVAAACCR